MGAAFSRQSYLRYQNDFELVIRATKDLERLLEQQFDAPSGKSVGLHDKITSAQQSHGLSASTVRQMRKLVTSALLPQELHVAIVLCEQLARALTTACSSDSGFHVQFETSSCTTPSTTL